MKSLVIYDSYFGNTEKLAQAVGKVFGTEKTVNLVRVADVDLAQLEGIDLLVVASPTRGFRPSEGTTKFLSSLPAGALQGVQAAVFDTRIDLETLKNKVFRFIVKRGGYANKAIAAALEKKGAVMLQPIEGFFVDDSEGPITAGEMERAEAWAAQIKAAVK
jgi:flavodoxin